MKVSNKGGVEQDMCWWNLIKKKEYTKIPKNSNSVRNRNHTFDTENQTTEHILVSYYSAKATIRKKLFPP